MEDHTILSSDGNFGNVTVCPGGVVHINLAHVSLKFVTSDFVRFSDLVNRARVTLGNRPPQLSGKPHLQLVTPEQPDDDSPDPAR